MGQYFVVSIYNYSSGQSGSGNTSHFKSKLSKASQEAVLHRHLLLESEKKKDNTTKKEDQILTVTETNVETKSGQTKIISYFIVINYEYFLGQPEMLEPGAATDEEEQFLIPASIDTKSGWKVGSYFIVGNCQALAPNLKPQNPKT